MKLSIKSDPTTGYYKTRLRKTFENFELEDFKNIPQRLDHRAQTTYRRPKTNLNLHIEDTEMTTHILSNLPEAYDKSIEHIGDELGYYKYSLTIKIIHDKISLKYDQMNV